MLLHLIDAKMSAEGAYEAGRLLGIRLPLLLTHRSGAPQ